MLSKLKKLSNFNFKLNIPIENIFREKKKYWFLCSNRSNQLYLNSSAAPTLFDISNRSQAKSHVSARMTVQLLSRALLKIRMYWCKHSTVSVTPLLSFVRERIVRLYVRRQLWVSSAFACVWTQNTNHFKQNSR